MDFFVNKGWTPEQAAGICNANNIMPPSSMLVDDVKSWCLANQQVLCDIYKDCSDV
jgi:hypothetical protein